MIVRLEREIFHVLNMNGKVVEVRPQALHKKKEYRNTIALDSDQQTIQRKDIVKVIDGPHSVSFLSNFSLRSALFKNLQLSNIVSVQPLKYTPSCDARVSV